MATFENWDGEIFEKRDPESLQEKLADAVRRNAEEELPEGTEEMLGAIGALVLEVMNHAETAAQQRMVMNTMMAAIVASLLRKSLPGRALLLITADGLPSDREMLEKVAGNGEVQIPEEVLQKYAFNLKVLEEVYGEAIFGSILPPRLIDLDEMDLEDDDKEEGL